MLPWHVTTLLVDTAVAVGKAEIGLLTGDVELMRTALHGSETHRKIFEMASEAITQTVEDLGPDSSPGQKGYVIGKIVFEVASMLIPATKAGTLMQVTKSQVLHRLISKPGLLRNGARNVAIRKAGVCNGPWGCFMADTQIVTPSDAGHTNIESIRRDDLVWARNPDCPEQSGWKRVTDVQVTHPREIYHLTYELCGPPESEAGCQSVISPTTETLRVTGEHPFWVEREEFKGFVPVNALLAGDVLVRADGGSAVVTRKTIQYAPPGETLTTYNFTVEGYHTYFVGLAGIWVHNAYTRAQSRQRMATLTDDLAQRIGRDIDNLGPDRFTILTQQRGAILKAGEKIPDKVWMNLGHDSSNRMMQDFLNGVITRVDDMPTVRRWEQGFYMRQFAGVDWNKYLSAGDYDLHHIGPKQLTALLKRQEMLPPGFDPDMVPGMIMTRADHVEMNKTLNPLINALDNDDVDGVVAINRVIDAYRHELGQPAQAAVLEAFYKKLGILPDP